MRNAQTQAEDLKFRERWKPEEMELDERQVEAYATGMEGQAMDAETRRSSQAYIEDLERHGVSSIKTILRDRHGWDQLTLDDVTSYEAAVEALRNEVNLETAHANADALKITEVLRAYQTMASGHLANMANLGRDYQSAKEHYDEWIAANSAFTSQTRVPLPELDEQGNIVMVQDEETGEQHPSIVGEEAVLFINDPANEEYEPYRAMMPDLLNMAYEKMYPGNLGNMQGLKAQYDSARAESDRIRGNLDSIVGENGPLLSKMGGGGGTGGGTGGGPGGEGGTRMQSSLSDPSFVVGEDETMDQAQARLGVGTGAGATYDGFLQELEQASLAERGKQDTIGAPAVKRTSLRPGESFSKLDADEQTSALMRLTRIADQYPETFLVYLDSYRKQGIPVDDVFKNLDTTLEEYVEQHQERLSSLQGTTFISETAQGSVERTEAPSALSADSTSNDYMKWLNKESVRAIDNIRNMSEAGASIDELSTIVRGAVDEGILNRAQALNAVWPVDKKPKTDAEKGRAAARDHFEALLPKRLEMWRETAGSLRDTKLFGEGAGSRGREAAERRAEARRTFRRGGN
jgi:hypothetical protein